MPYPIALLNDLGGGEILLIAIVGLLLFGKSLPSVARNLGRAVAEFKRGMAQASVELQREMNAAAQETETRTPPPAAPIQNILADAAASPRVSQENPAPAHPDKNI